MARGFKKVVSQLKDKKMLETSLAVLREASRLQDEGSVVVFERDQLDPHYDVDVATVKLDGTIEQSEIVNGVVHGTEREWAEDGRLVVEAVYDDGKLVERKRYDQTT